VLVGCAATGSQGGADRWGGATLSDDFPAPGGLARRSRLAGYRGGRAQWGAGETVVVSGHAMSGWARLVALKVLAPALAVNRRRGVPAAVHCRRQAHPAADLPVMECRRKGVEESRTSPAQAATRALS
jgi:hypothetical protein